MLNFNLLKALTWANLKSRYRNTFFGFLWVILNPIIVLFVQAFLFSIVFKIQHQNYFVFLMAGLLPWLFIVQSVEMCTGMFVSHANIIKNIPISPLSLLFTQVMDNYFNFVISFLAVAFIFYFQGKIDLINVALYSIPMILILITVASIAVILATLNILFRDLKFVSSFLLSLMFYLTPIFYPARYIPRDYQFILDINIFYYLLKPFQILSSNFYMSDFISSLLNSLLVSFTLVAIAHLIWKKYRKYLVIYA